MTLLWNSFGAAREVPGSCHLLEYGDKRVLIDCGIFQGKGSQKRNEPPFPFQPETIDCVIVTHAHLDHIGRLPLLVKEGFSGRIVSTRATYELARLSLADSVSIMASDARRENRRRKERGQSDTVTPLFDENDMFETIDRWNATLDYEQTHSVAPGIELTVFDAGHILGSSSLLLELSGAGESMRVAISGDIGDDGRTLACDPAPGPDADLAVIESTYGDRDHRSQTESIAELQEVICDTFDRGGNVVIPTFALERAQELLFLLHDAWKGGQIPKMSKIFLDSPMATTATGIYRRHLHLLNDRARAEFGTGSDPFNFQALDYTRTTQESAAINSISSGAVILAGSGMVTGGRVLDHLRHNLGRPESSVVFVGYQAEGTKGRQIVDGTDSVRIHGLPIQPRASVHTIGGFSAHAGQSKLVEWVQQTGADQAYLVHGEQRSMDPLATRLQELGIRAEMPESGEVKQPTN